MHPTPFTRSTITAAAEYTERHSQARFDQMVLRLGFEAEIPRGTVVSVAKKCALLADIVLQRPTQVTQTVDGNVTLAEAVVREAVQLLRPESTRSDQPAFLRGLARDGYVVSWNGREPTLRAALPSEVDLPAADHEIHQLLAHFNFHSPLSHIRQAIEAHTRGDWAAANGQLRTFLESLFDDIARTIRPVEAAQRPTSENRRALLADVGFLAIDRNEWTQDGKTMLMACLECCLPTVRIRVFQMRTTALFACI